MARRFYNEQEPDLYEDQFGSFYYDPYTGEFVSIPATSGIGAPEVAYYDPAPVQTYYDSEQTYYDPGPEQTYYDPAPVYYDPAPAPTYYDPAPVYYPPARESEETYYDPTPVYYEPPPPPPVYVAPPPPPPAPEPAPAPVYYPPARESAETYYEPEPVYVAPTPAPAPVSGIGSPAAISYAPEQTYTQATVAQSAEPAPVSGIGNSAPPPFVPQYREPEPQYFAPEPFFPQYQEPTYTPPAPPAPQPMAQPGVPEMTPEFIQQLQQGAAAVGNAAQSGDISALFAPGTLSTLDPLFDYAKTAPVLTLKGNTEYENLSFQPLPDTKYQLTVGGKAVGAASNPQEVARLVDQANAISEQGGANVDVRLQREVQAADKAGNPYTAFEDVYSNKENNMGALETLIPLALSVMGGLALGPLIQGGAVAGSASALGAGLGSAAGSFAGNLAVGKGLEESLIKAGISGLTAGALKGVMPGGNGIGQMPDVDFAGLENIVFGGSTALPAAALEPLITSTASTLGSTALPEIVVSAARNVIAPSVLSGLTAASGSLLGDVGKSLTQPDQFQQAVDQGRIENRFGPAPDADEILALGQRAVPTIPGTEVLAPITGGAVTAPLSPQDLPAQPAQPAQPPGEPEIVVSGTAIPKVDLIGGLGGAAAAGGFDQFLSDNAGMVGDGTAQQPAEAPADEEIVVTSQPTPRVDLSGLGGLVPALIPTPPAAPAVEILPGETLLEAVAKRLPGTRLDAGLSAATGSLFPAASADVSLPGEELIDVAARRIPETRLDSGLAAAAGALTPAAQPVAEVVPGEIVVTSTPTRPGEISSGISALTPEVISNIVSATESLGYAPSTVEEEALAEGRRYEKPSIASALAVPVSQTYPIAEGATDVLPDDETLVEGRRIQPPPIDAALVGLPVAAAVAAPAVLSGGAAPQGPLGTSTPSTVETGAAGTGGLTAKQVINGLTAANAVGALISDALAGGGGGGGPLDVGTGYIVPTGRARQLAAATFDPFTYGQREGEFAFFGDGMAEGGEVDDDMVSHLIAYRKGGGHMGPGQVKGIGSGQEDKIPAWLSDGEYVWSAQDVADLGDGSTDEGVRRLDKMRQMVRKGAGRKDVKKIAKPQRGIEDMLKAVGGAV